MILKYRRNTVRDIADEVGISFGSCQAIFLDVLSIKQIRSGTAEFLINRVDITHELLTEVSNNPEFL